MVLGLACALVGALAVFVVMLYRESPGEPPGESHDAVPDLPPGWLFVDEISAADQKD